MKLINNYLKIFFRSLFKNKETTILNIIGLSIGLLIAIYSYISIYNEFSLYRFHKNSENIFQIHNRFHFDSGIKESNKIAAPIAPSAYETISGIKSYVRIFNLNDLVLKVQNNDGYTLFNELNGISTDSSFIEVFTLDMIVGDPFKFLDTPNSIYLSKELSKKYFGTISSIGEEIRIRNSLFIVKGVYRETQIVSGQDINFIIPFGFLESLNVDIVSYTYNMFYSYVTIERGQLYEDINQVMKKNLLGLSSAIGIKAESYLVPYKEKELGDKLFLFMIIAVIAIVISCMNFISISNAKILDRIKEVGIRKVLGAGRINIIVQFLSETFMLTLFAIILSLSIIILIEPVIQNVTGLSLRINIFDLNFIIGLVILSFIIVIFAGIFPTLRLSRFLPVDIIKSNQTLKSKKLSFKSVLIFAQFFISTFSILMILNLGNQFEFMNQNYFGFDKDNVMVLKSSEFYNKGELLKNELLKKPDIDGIAVTEDLPFNISDGVYFSTGDQSQKIFGYQTFVGCDFDNVLNIELKEGRFFSKNHKADDENKIILNESAAKLLGLEPPICGTDIYLIEEKYTVIGIVKNFSFHSLVKEVQPLALQYNNERAKYMLVKFQNDDNNDIRSGLLEYIQNSNINFPDLTCFSLDQLILENSSKVTKLFNFFLVMCYLSLIIPVIGLIGLLMYNIKTRKKEVGIRKIHGAETGNIITLFLNGYLKIFVGGIILGIIAAYFLLQQIYQDYAYHLDLNVIFFTVIGFAIISVAVLTIIVPIIRASRLNPVEVIYSE